MKQGKKIVFTGKPNAGKTTLIDVFFNGESCKKLLDYLPPAPTYGYNVQILALRQKIGVFDLSGQENERWFKSEDRAVFYDASTIIVVIDVTTDKYDIEAFIQGVLDLRKEIVPSARIHVLIHKIDLINLDDLVDLKNFLNECFEKSKKLEIHFTSIKKGYLFLTFEIFIKILRDVLNRNDFENEYIDFPFLRNTLNIVKTISQEKSLEPEQLQDKCNLSYVPFKQIINLLLRKNHIRSKEDKYSLTEKGKKHFEDIIKNVSLSQLNNLDSEALSSVIPSKKEIPPFTGGLISDKSGKTIAIIESEKDLLEHILKHSRKREPERFDIELIPMFVSALEKFSSEINIKDISGLNLKGNRLNMQVFSYKDFTATCFFNSNVNLEKVSSKVQNHFERVLNIHRKELKKITMMREEGFLNKFKTEQEIWIKKFNEEYKDLEKEDNSLNFEFIDSLYQTINMISEKNQNTPFLTQKQIMGLKKQLIKAAAEENTKALTTIKDHLHNLRNKIPLKAN